jgi:hypothetical protein
MNASAARTIVFILFCLASACVKAQPCITLAETCNEDACGYDYCGPYELSHGVYRLPFVDGTELEVTCDHLSHCPRGRLDLIGTGGDVDGEYHIAAAADGWIRAIVDNHSVQCDCSVDDCENNYLWMEHPDGEWTKYTHFKQNSVTNLGHFEGEWVTAGTNLGNEGDVGCASGVHLHFEVAQPVDTNTLVFSESGGYLDEDWAKNVIPVFCGISGNVVVKGESYAAGDCPASCNGILVPLPATYDVGEYEVILNEGSISSSEDVTFAGYSAGLFQAGVSVTLTEGFEVKTNANFLARIADCDEFAQREESLHEVTSEWQSANSMIRVYPNPANGLTRVIIQNKVSEENILITIHDAAGKAVSSFRTGSGIEVELDVSLFSQGIYLITARGETIADAVPFVVQ